MKKCTTSSFIWEENVQLENKLYFDIETKLEKWLSIHERQLEREEEKYWYNLAHPNVQMDYNLNRCTLLLQKDSIFIIDTTYNA